MARINPIPHERMSPEQIRVNGSRPGGATGPHSIWLRSPELAMKAAALLTHVRSQSTLSPRLQELAILIAARAWTAQYA